MGKKLKPSASLIDLDTLPEDVRWRVVFALETAQKAHDHDAAMLEACRNAGDAELIAFGEKEYPGAPMGISTWYARVRLEQETIFNRVAHNAERRPVFLRGAKHVRIRAHCRTPGGGSPNGWAANVFWRVVRIMRLTALSYDEYAEATKPIYAHLTKRYALTHQFYEATSQNRIGWGSDLAVINGKVVFLPRDGQDRIKQIYRMVKKTERLEAAITKEMCNDRL